MALASRYHLIHIMSSCLHKKRCPVHVNILLQADLSFDVLRIMAMRPLPAQSTPFQARFLPHLITTAHTFSYHGSIKTVNCGFRKNHIELYNGYKITNEFSRVISLFHQSVQKCYPLGRFTRRQIRVIPDYFLNCNLPRYCRFY